MWFMRRSFRCLLKILMRRSRSLLRHILPHDLQLDIIIFNLDNPLFLLVLAQGLVNLQEYIPLLDQHLGLISQLGMSDR